MSAKNGVPAFPTVTREGKKLSRIPGMTLRDYFAAKAMQGILAGPCSRDGVPAKEWFDIPRDAYKLADAMLKARES